MFSNLLVATDLSSASHRVVCASASLKQLGAKKAVLLYCANVSMVDENMVSVELLKSVEPDFAMQKKNLIDNGFEVTGEMLNATYYAINNQADAHNSSLIVIGSIGRTMSGKTKLGSVANAVVHGATRPVLIFRVMLAEKGKELYCQECSFDMMEHILFPTDFSENSEHAFGYVQKMADCGAQRITLMHVQNKSRLENSTEEQLREHNRMDSERLERLKADLGKKGAKNVDIVLPYGLPKQEIVEYTNRNRVSLVVMGSQGRGYIKEFFLGSVSHSVARYSDSSVLLIPPLK